MPTPLFNPGPEETQELLLALADPELSLQDIADKHGTSLSALSLALLRPDITEALSALQSAFASRTRLCAANHLPIAAAALVTILSDHADHCAHTPVQPNLKAQELRRRQHETARKAAFLLHRLGNYDPTRPTRQRSSEPGRPRPEGLPNQHLGAHPSSPPEGAPDGCQGWSEGVPARAQPLESPAPSPLLSPLAGRGQTAREACDQVRGGRRPGSSSSDAPAHLSSSLPLSPQHSALSPLPPLPSARDPPL